MPKIHLTIIFLFTLIFTNEVFAASNDFAADSIKASEDFTAKPTATFWALGGKQFIGTGQGIIPLGTQGVKSIFYAALEAAGSTKKSNGYAAGFAAGFRNIINDSYILGGYLFADYNRSPAGHYFWVANPGFEALGKVWDFRVNGYIPTTCRHWLGGEELAENIGITQFEKAIVHDRYDHLFQWYEEVGPGVDAEVGRQIPIVKNHNLKVYVGGYHYFMDKTDAITGGEGRIVFPLSKYVSLEARDSYDKVRKNVFMGGVRISFGGYNSEDKDSLGITGRLVDPIEHNFGNFAAANSIAVGKAYVDEGIEFHLPGNFWYFNNSTSPGTMNVSSGDGTFEHPFTAIDPRSFQIMTNSGIFSQNVQMYVATGLSPYDLSVMPDHRLPLPFGYSIFGRTADFKLAAKGSLRPELDGGMTAFGGNNINDIRLNSVNQNFGTRGVLFIFGPQFINAVNLNDVNINVTENLTEAAGISVMNSYLTINNSQINVSSTAKSKQNFGIDLVNNSALFVGDNNSIHTSIASNLPFETDTSGIAGNGPVKIYGNNNQIEAAATGFRAHAIGIFVFNNRLEIAGNNNSILANASGFDSRAGGILNVGTTLISGNNNQIIGNASGVEGKSLGIADSIEWFGKTKLSSEIAQIIISGSNNQIAATSAESDAAGIVLHGGALKLFGSNNQINANTISHVTGRECIAYGIANLGNGAITIAGFNNKIAVNSAFDAYGIFLDPTITATKLSVKNTFFNVVTTGGTAAGISLEKLTDASHVTLQNNILNVAATGAGSKAYGIFLPKATIPVAFGHIAGNIFNITNSNAPHDAWGVYANSAWKDSAAWIRALNIWIQPTAATPEQQVFTQSVPDTTS